jgi:transcription-repair coupling factor (superfamily II helicase)
VLAVVTTEAEAGELVDDLRCLLPPDSVALYPAWETLPHERLSPRADTVGQRLAVLHRLQHPDATDATTGPLSVVVAPVRSVLQPQVPRLGDLEPVAVKVGDTGRELTDIVGALINAGYARTELVERRGDVAVRGGILDVFPPTEEHPVRVEFWGDDVEEVRYFSVADQRSLGAAEHGLWAPPCRELLLTDEVRARAKEVRDAHPELAELLDPISEGTAVEGMEALAPVLVDGLTVLTAELPVGTHVVVSDPERLRRRAVDLVRTSAEFLEASWAAAAGGGSAPVALGAASLRELADVEATTRAAGVPWWSITPFETDTETSVDAGLASSFAEAPDYRGDLAAVLDDLRGWVRAGWRVAAVLDGPGTADRAVERLRDAELPAVREETLTAVPERGRVAVTTGRLAGGLVNEKLGLVLLTESDLTGQRGISRDGPRLPSRRRKTLDPLQLQAGDLVVHDQHGVGRYVEMVRRTVNGGEREYLIIEYAAGP